MRTLVLTLALLGAGPAHAACDAARVDLRGPFGTASFAVEIADTPEERAQGLMFRERLATSAGMLFVYEAPQPVAFWMKNTLIPLDMIFTDAAGVVTKVHENAVPEDLTSIPGEGDVLTVLEINGGLARAIGIAPGAELRHPALPQDTAAWPCDE
jgi:uncharacterized membrane protein (UPF0127 family)